MPEAEASASGSPFAGGISHARYETDGNDF